MSTEVAHSVNRAVAGVLRSWVILIATGVAWVWVGCPAAAEAQGGLFTLQLVVEDKQESSREKAIKQGLERLIGRMSGDYHGLSQEHPAYDMLANAERYIEGYRYTRDDEQLSLELRFDASAVTTALGEREVAVWGGHRRPLLVWALADLNDGRRVMISEGERGYSPSAQELLDTIHRQAKARGLPIMYPLLDWRDMNSLGYADVWGGFADHIRQASARYGAATVLTVGLRQTATGAWRAHWTALLGETSLTRSSGPGALDKVVGEIFDLIGHRLIERYAAVPGPEGITLEIVVLGIDGLGEYVGLSHRLGQVAGVEEIRPIRVDAKRVVLELVLGQEGELVLDTLDELPYLLVESVQGIDLDETASRAVRAYRWLGE